MTAIDPATDPAIDPARDLERDPARDPASIVQRQLDAYNARDLDALISTHQK